MRKLLAAIGITALVALGGSAAYASIPASDGTIKTCYWDAGIGQGALHVIDSEDTCPSGFTELTFNQVGQPGVSGYEVVSQNLQIVGPDPAGTDDRSIECPAGKVVLGASFGPDIVRGLPQTDGSGWDFSINHPSVDSSSTYQSSQRITCATVGS